MATAPKKVKRAPVRADTKGKSGVLRSKPTKTYSITIKPTKTPTVRHFKVGDRVLFDYGKREVEGTVTSTSGDRVHVDMHFAADESTPGLFRENELRSA